MTNLPASLKPTPEVFARDQELASEGNALLEELSRESGLRVRTNVETYNAVTFGPDGTPVARVRNGQPLQTREEEAVAKAQAAANSEINRLERDLRDLINRRDEISAYDSDGNPIYVRGAAARKQLDAQVRHVHLGLINQKRLNERRWRKEAAPAVRRAENERIAMQELAAQLEKEGRGQRLAGW